MVSKSFLSISTGLVQAVTPSTCHISQLNLCYAMMFQALLFEGLYFLGNYVCIFTYLNFSVFKR